MTERAASTPPVFAEFLPPPSDWGDTERAAIGPWYLAGEPEVVARLLAAAETGEVTRSSAQVTARKLVEAIRRAGPGGMIAGIVKEYDLSTPEGIALMRLAEALLRTPDSATRDALIRDKIGTGNWVRHLGGDKPLLVNATTWGLIVAGKVVGGDDAVGVVQRLAARRGAPFVRRAMDAAMRMLGARFVTGETIEAALRNARSAEARGFSYSYDMLGEAALTADDAARYDRDYTMAIHAIGKAAQGRGPYAGPGISIKLSALHPRYERAQQQRVMSELLPLVERLAKLACMYGIGFNIDAEESERLDLSLDVLSHLCAVPALADWNGLGFVVQAYQKRALSVVDWVIDLARRTGRRIMVRLVKGAYWDSEIKRAQIEGLPDYPVFTRKVHTDLSYLACARRLLGARDGIFPQFATHNAHSVAAIHAMAGPLFRHGDYEFQCLHGMGEGLYEEVVPSEKLGRPCRIYAPVGTHETLLAYLVRRLLENGANSSFVNRIQDTGVPVEHLIADPVSVVGAEPLPGAPNVNIPAPSDIAGTTRKMARGINLADTRVLATLSDHLRAHALQHVAISDGTSRGLPRRIVNPALRTDCIGTVIDTDLPSLDAMLSAGSEAAVCWRDVAPVERAAVLHRAAFLLEDRMPELLALVMREAGKTIANAVAEVREAVDFLRYYAAQCAAWTVRREPLGLVVCISPWNFPLAIFTGQIAAAVAAGNAVIAKPAEETPLIAATMIALLRDAGVPHDVVQYAQGAGDIGAALVGDRRVQGVLFTGSLDVARQIAGVLARRGTAWGAPVPFVAETGGQNVMIVDSSALAEQVVQDVIASAFDSAGQRCSALRVLCVQQDVADRVLNMLKATMNELRVGRPDRFSTDIGPVISDAARDMIAAHIAAMRQQGRPVHQAPLSDECRHGTFVAPTLIEIDDLSSLTREIFGPVLHVLRYRGDEADTLIDRINALGYGLTFGLHSRVDNSIAHITSRIDVGNIYINRNIVGAVVGIQPFGGHGLSGTGPKAGGPLYLARVTRNVGLFELAVQGPDAALAAWCGAAIMARTPTPMPLGTMLPGPVGETNWYETRPRGAGLCEAATREALLAQVAACLATGNDVLLSRAAMILLGPVPAVFAARVRNVESGEAYAFVLFEGAQADLIALCRDVAQRQGPIVPVHCQDARGLYPLALLLGEYCISTNSAAAGGNAQLMALPA